MKENVVYFKYLRKENFPYVLIWIFYYAWVIVFTTWWTSSPLTDAVYGDAMRTNLHAVNLIASAIFVLIFKKEWFIYTARIGAVILALTSSLFLFVPVAAGVQVILLILFGISLGCVNISILMPFVFAMNNTEKFYSVTGSNLIICIIMFLQTTGKLNITNGIYASFVILMFSLSFIIFFKKDCIEKEKPKNTLFLPKTKKIIYFTLIINIVFAVFCKGIGHMLLLAADEKTDYPLNFVFYIGGILGCLIFILLYFCAKKSNHAAWNITFGTFILAMVLFFIDNKNEYWYLVFSLLLGIGSTMGMINMYYILGVIGKKYWSIGYVRASIIFIGIFGGVSGVVFGNLAMNLPDGISIVITAIASVIFIAFLIISPTLSWSYFNDDWADDSKLPEIDNEKLYTYKQYKLTERETEVCRLLLDGYTLRQISGILGIAYPTVNTYSTNIYKKTGINSRTELFLLFKYDKTKQ